LVIPISLFGDVSTSPNITDEIADLFSSFPVLSNREARRGKFTVSFIFKIETPLSFPKSSEPTDKFLPRF